MNHRGNIDHHLIVDGTVVVQGALRAGGTVRGGGELIVQGSVTGDLVIEGDAGAEVQGALGAMVALRGGTLLAAGAVTPEFSETDGDFYVCVGSVVGGGTFQSEGLLLHDGTIQALSGTIPKLTINNTAENYRKFNFADRRFVSPRGV